MCQAQCGPDRTKQSELPQLVRRARHPRAETGHDAPGHVARRPAHLRERGFICRDGQPYRYRIAAAGAAALNDWNQLNFRAIIV